MDTLTWIFMGIAILFFLILILKNIFNLKKICVICASVMLSWIILLTLYFLNIFPDKTIIALLMGQTSLGLFYIWEKKVKEKFTIFRLPLLLTLIFIIYTTLENFILSSLIFLLVLWVVFILIYFFRNSRNFNQFTTKLIECCKKW